MFSSEYFKIDTAQFRLREISLCSSFASLHVDSTRYLFGESSARQTIPVGLHCRKVRDSQPSSVCVGGGSTAANSFGRSLSTVSTAAAANSPHARFFESGWNTTRCKRSQFQARTQALSVSLVYESGLNAFTGNNTFIALRPSTQQQSRSVTIIIKQIKMHAIYQ